MSIEAMKQALKALEMLARYENPETRIQVRKPNDGGPIVTMYPHKVASDAATALRAGIEQAEKQEPVGEVLNERGEVDYISYVPPVGTPLYTAPPASDLNPNALEEIEIALPDLEPFAYSYMGIKQDGSTHGPHLVWKPEYMDAMSASKGAVAIPLYTAPRQWVELTDDEARALVNRATFGDKTNWQALVYMVDAKLKEKNAA